MSAPDGWSTSGAELGDNELDATLSGVCEELRAYVRAAGDPLATLIAIMADDDADVTAEVAASWPLLAADVHRCHHAVLVLMMRLRARILDHEVGLARTFARTRALAREIAADRNVILAVGTCLAHARDIALAVDVGLARAHAIDGTRGRAIGLVRELARELACAVDNVRDIVFDIAHAIDVGLARSPDGEPGYDLVCSLDRSLDRDLNCVSDRATAILCCLDRVSVDASSVDLSDLELADLEVLRGVVWTDDTIWPLGLATTIRARSREIQPGVFQVTGGTEVDVDDLVVPV